MPGFYRGYKLKKARIIAQVCPVCIRLEPEVIFVAQPDGPFQPLKGLDLSPLKQVGRSQPVSNVMIRFSNFSHMVGQLLVRLSMLSLRAQTDCQNRADTIHFRMALKYLLK